MSENETAYLRLFPVKMFKDPTHFKEDSKKVHSFFILGFVSAPNSYSLPPMLGITFQSGKIQAPCYSLVGRSKVGSFSEDLGKVSNLRCGLALLLASIELNRY